MAEVDANEESGKRLAEKLGHYIEANGGQYLRDDAGLLHVILVGDRIPLNLDRDNQSLAELMLSACDVTLLSHAAQVAIQRLQVMVRRGAGKITLRRFSAFSPDQTKLYIPVSRGELLAVWADGLTWVTNGEKDDLWVEHPNGEPLLYKASKEGLEHFERLLVETQAYTVPAMKWLVAMQLGLFPYVRDLCSARLIMELIGPQQSGKTSGAARFTQLHGLGDVLGDFSVAALANSGDIGLLVMDNREQQNFTQELIDFCLFLATGAERGRSYSDGTLRPRLNGRPVGVITTIEGVVKAELQARCVEVQYGVPGKRLRREPIEREIRKLRHEIGSALVQVLVHFLNIRDVPARTPNPLPNFQEHFTVLCNLLRAHAQASGKPTEWSEDIIAAWNTEIVRTEADEDDLEHPLDRVLKEHQERFTQYGVTLNGSNGILHVATAGELLTALQKLNLRDQRLPKNTNGLTRRLNSSTFHGFTYLRTGTPGRPELARKAHRKPLGFFKADDVTDEELQKSAKRQRLGLDGQNHYIE